MSYAINNAKRKENIMIVTAWNNGTPLKSGAGYVGSLMLEIEIVFFSANGTL